MKKKLIALSGVIGGLAPLAVFAQNSPVGDTCARALNSGTIETVICRIGSILNTIIPFLIVLGVLYFVWGVVQYVIASDEEAKKAGRNRMVFGIIGLVVIVGVWGLVGIVTRTFDLNRTTPINVPCVVGTPGC
jgi:hypothetical protein